MELAWLLFRLINVEREALLFEKKLFIFNMISVGDKELSFIH